MLAFWLFSLSRVVVAGSSSSVFDDATVIPRVDLTLPQKDIISAVRKAAESGGPGFFYLVGHGIPESIFDDVVRAAHIFYSLPIRQKLNVSAVGYGGGTSPSKGYVPPLSEGAYQKDASDVRPEEEQASGKRNTRESFVFRFPEESDVKDEKYWANYEHFLKQLDEDVGMNMVSPSQQSASKQPSHADNRVTDISKISPEARRFFLKNQWPSHEGGPAFRDVVQRYFAEMNKLAQIVFGIFSEALLQTQGIDQNLSIPLGRVMPHDKGMTTFNIVRYPPSKHTDGAMGIVDHTDWEAFTLLSPFYLRKHHVDTCSTQIDAKADDICAPLRKSNPNFDENTGVYYTGLEVWFEDRWVAVPRIPGAVLVNQGEMLSRLSGGKFKAPVHRVQAHNEFERYSLVSFWAPNYDVYIPDPDMPLGKVLTGEHYLNRNGFFV